MAILKRKSATKGTTRYQVVIDLIDPVSGKRERRSKGTYATLREARKVHTAWQSKRDQGAVLDPAKATVRELVEQWLKAKAPSIAPNSHYEYRVAAELHVLPALGGVSIHKLNHMKIQTQVTEWLEAGLSERLARRCVSVLRQSYDLALKSAMVGANPALGVEFPPKSRKRDISVFTPEQLDSFLEASKADALSPLWHLLALEGCRRGEGLGLRWQDIDLEHGRITFAQQVIPDVTNKGHAIVKPGTKTRASHRTVPLLAETVQALRDYRDRERLRLKGDFRESNLIFRTRTGEPINPANVKRNLKAILQRANLPSITPHDLRHHAATAMLAEGASLIMVSQKLGHSSTSVTSDFYAHLIPGDLTAANDAMSRRLAKAKSQVAQHG